jgi:hypothetical protein
VNGGGAGGTVFNGNNAVAGTGNTGGGGGGAFASTSSGGASGGSGIVVIRYADSLPNLQAISGVTKTGGGLTPTTTTGGFKIYEFTAGTGTVTF